MSLQEEIDEIMEKSYFPEGGFDRDLSAEIINKALDAAVEAAISRTRGQGAFKDTDSPMGWEFNAGIREAITEINKLRPKS